jgi:threonine dehydrogenase-like Zn-dependent dehydrogenase
MWAAALLHPGHLVPTTVARPTAGDLGDGQVLLRVEAGGICGSDGPFLRGAPTRFGTAASPGFWGPPGFPMHEVAGLVLASRHPEIRVGERVVGWADGFDGASEDLVTNGDAVATYDPGLSPTEAVLLQPLACVLHAVGRLGALRGRRSAVLGVGPIGALFVHVLADGGASVVGIDRVDRGADAGKLGASVLAAVDSGAWAAALPADERPDLVVEAVGHQMATLQHALVAVAPSGTVFYFGVPDSDVYPIDMELMVRKHLTLMAGGTLERRRALQQADDYLRRHPHLVATLVTHVFDRGDIQLAYDCATRPAPGRYKVVVAMR